MRDSSRNGPPTLAGQNSRKSSGHSPCCEDPLGTGGVRRGDPGRAGNLSDVSPKRAGAWCARQPPVGVGWRVLPPCCAGGSPGAGPQDCASSCGMTWSLRSFLRAGLPPLVSVGSWFKPRGFSSGSSSLWLRPRSHSHRAQTLVGRMVTQRVSLTHGSVHSSDPPEQGVQPVITQSSLRRK